MYNYLAAFLIFTLLAAAMPSIASNDLNPDTRERILEKHTNKKITHSSAITFRYCFNKQCVPPKNGQFSNVDPHFDLKAGISLANVKGTIDSFSLFYKSKSNSTKYARFVTKQEFGEFYGQLSDIRYFVTGATPIKFNLCTNYTIYAVFETSNELLWNSVDVKVPGCRENG